MRWPTGIYSRTTPRHAQAHTTTCYVSVQTNDCSEFKAPEGYLSTRKMGNHVCCEASHQVMSVVFLSVGLPQRCCTTSSIILQARDCSKERQKRAAKVNTQANTIIQEVVQVDPSPRDATLAEFAAQITKSTLGRATTTPLACERAEQRGTPETSIPTKETTTGQDTRLMCDVIHLPGARPTKYRLAPSISGNLKATLVLADITPDPALPDQISHATSDQGLYDANDASLRSWVSPRTSSPHVPQRHLPRRTDSAMQSTRHNNRLETLRTPTLPVGSKIPNAPSLLSANGVSLAPIDPRAFSRIPGAKQCYKPCTKSVRSSFDTEFQDLANDPEVLAMIDAKHPCRSDRVPMGTNLRSTAPALATGLDGERCPSERHGHITTGFGRHIDPSSMGHINTWVDGFQVSLPLCEVLSQVFLTKLSDVFLKVQDTEGCGRIALPRDSVRTDVSDQVRLPLKGAWCMSSCTMCYSSRMCRSTYYRQVWNVWT